MGRPCAASQLSVCRVCRPHQQMGWIGKQTPDLVGTLLLSLMPVEMQRCALVCALYLFGGGQGRGMMI